MTLLFSALALTSCASQVGRYEFYSDDANLILGDAVNQNIAAQTVDPDGADGDVTASGARVGIAQDRYRADKVEKPKAAGTQQSKQGGQPGQGQGGQSGGNN